MEILFEILFVLIQLFAEFLLYLVIPDPLTNRVENDSYTRFMGRSLLMCFLGGLGGLLMSFLVPKLILPSTALRVTAMVLIPLACGFVAWAIGERRKSNGAKIEPMEYAASAFLFILAFEVVRFFTGKN